MQELEEKGYMAPESTALIEESGLHSTRFVFNLQRLGQALLYKLKEHEDSINDLYSKDKEKDTKIVKLEREVEQLKRQLYLQNIKEAKCVKEYEM